VGKLMVLAGGAWWTAGAVVLPPGAATLVLAIGLAVTVALWIAGRGRAPRADGPTEPVRQRITKLSVWTLVLLGLAVLVMGWIGWGEVAAPVACGLVGLQMLRLGRGSVVPGLALLAIALVGGLLAVRTAGPLYAQGMVGLAAGAVLWFAAAQRFDLIRELRTRVAAR
jgi:hypothetical protein